MSLSTLHAKILALLKEHDKTMEQYEKAKTFSSAGARRRPWQIVAELTDKVEAVFKAETEEALQKGEKPC